MKDLTKLSNTELVAIKTDVIAGRKEMTDDELDALAAEFHRRADHDAAQARMLKHVAKAVTERGVHKLADLPDDEQKRIIDAAERTGNALPPVN